MRLAAAIMVVIATVTPTSAQDAAPQAPLRPMPRPESPTIVTVPPLNVATPAIDAPDGPSDPSILAAAIGQRDVLRLDDATQAACLATLKDMGAVFEEVAAVVPDDDMDCGILQPVKVSQIAPGIALDPAATLRCPAALALAAWVQDFVLPAATRLDGPGALTAIENGSGYICRKRNNAADGALSEHAFGNAFDVMGFRFEQGPTMMIGPRAAQGNLEQAFQDTVWAAACLDFSTVLGPGSNAAHDDHLHLDIKARTNGFRLCELGRSVAQ